jgi:undecaprenyl diphosphate synthase
MGCRHIGIIMDGNGRWAKCRGEPRTHGHLEGLKAARRIVAAASRAGLSFLTLYTFSTENWKRAATEVDFIMGLIKQHLMRELDFYRENHIRIRHAGDISALPKDVADDLRSAMTDTADFDGLQVVLAINYGGRSEIVRAVNRLPDRPISEADISATLDNPDIPDPDLIIRTAGEFRVSNFLLWEAAYAEYFISDKYWPDFTADDLIAAIENFNKRERRFGGAGLGGTK